MAKSKKKKRVFKIKNIIIILGLLLLFSGVIFYWLKKPINNIYISGNDIVSDNEILTLSGLDTYPSFLLTSRFKIRKIILENDYIDSVDVIKKIGNVIELEAVEYMAIAKDMEEKIILSSGLVVDNNYNINDVPRLVSHLNDEVMVEFVRKFSLIDNNILREISEIEYSPVLVDEDRFLLYMDDGNQVYVTLTKIEKINKYNDIKDELEGKSGVIYLDSGDYVEMKS